MFKLSFSKLLEVLGSQVFDAFRYHSELTQKLKQFLSTPQISPEMEKNYALILNRYKNLRYGVQVSTDNIP
jgi:hypothetical protein